MAEEEKEKGEASKKGWQKEIITSCINRDSGYRNCRGGGVFLFFKG